jgi:NAD(P)H-hydrate epimerase
MNEVETAILDCNSRYYHMDTVQLMENAGRSAAEEIEKRYGYPQKIALFCGLGNNGGDGVVAARFLAEKNEVCIYLVGNPAAIQTAEAKKNWDILQYTPVKTRFIRDSADIDIPDEYQVIVDALLGTGITGELREPVKTLVEQLNTLSGVKVSIDVPTGYKTTTAFKADLTISMHYPKIDNCTTVTIGVPHAFESLVGPGDVKFLKRRKKDSHKGDNGRVLIVGGSPVYHGAPLYAGLAAALVVDLVFIACPQSVAPVIKAQTPDFIVHPLSADILVPEDVPLILKLAASCDAVLVGPGAGTDKKTEKMCLDLLSHIEVCVVDADALKCLKNHTDIVHEKMILTPHKGEFTAVFGDTPVEKAAHQHRCTIVQKGATDIISNGVTTKYNHTGNAGMTTGGTGDVLAGLVAGFCATNNLFQACCAAAFVNGLAGDHCFNNAHYAYTASDVVEAIPSVLTWCRTF